MMNLEAYWRARNRRRWLRRDRRPPALLWLIGHRPPRKVAELPRDHRTHDGPLAPVTGASVAGQQ
jgi:hypothetical protein